MPCECFSRPCFASYALFLLLLFVRCLPVCFTHHIHIGCVYFLTAGRQAATTTTKETISLFIHIFRARKLIWPLLLQMTMVLLFFFHLWANNLHFGFSSSICCVCVCVFYFGDIFFSVDCQWQKRRTAQNMSCAIAWARSIWKERRNHVFRWQMDGSSFGIVLFTLSVFWLCGY